jgi:hypothetical protein
MASVENYFVVRTGLGVGTQALYADSVTKTVAIGKTLASDNVTLDVVGDIRATDSIFAETSLGVGTLDPQEELDVQGSAIIRDQFGVNTTNLDNYTARFNDNNLESVYITGIGSVGIGVSNPLYDADVLGNARISGFTSLTNSRIGFATIGVSTVEASYVGILTVGFGSIAASRTGVGTIITAFIDTESVGFSSIASALIVGANIGISTISFADITQEIVGLSTVGIATINNAYAGIITAAEAFIGQESVGISTIGIASIREARIGVATVGFASITNALVGFATITQEVVGISSITNSFIGISTIGIATIGIATIQTATIGFATVGILTASQFLTGIATIGSADIGIETVLESTIDNLRVIGVTTTGTLDVGIAGTIFTASEEFLPEEVYQTDGTTLEKVIKPLVGIGTTLPTRTLDIAGDIRIQGELIDSENNVGFAYSVIGAKYNIPGRFIDASNLLVRNKEFIANEVVGFITSTDGPFGVNGPNFDYGPVGVEIGRSKCKRDIGLIIDAIAFDISKGGNSKSVGAGLSYYDGVTLEYLDDSLIIPVGFSTGYVKQATLVGFSSVASLARYVINNSSIPKSYQVAGIGSIPQLFDVELLADGDSNTNPDGCANVVSAIYTCVGIVTTIINSGPFAAPKVNNPVGEIVWQPSGAIVGNEYFVAKYGNDSNQGLSPGDAFLTIKKACSAALPGDTVKIFSGLYVEEGPIQVPERVAVIGEDLRRTLVSTRGQTDLYHVRRGCYIAQQSFVGPENPNAMVSFPTQGKGYADGTEQNWQSPYVQNCTNFVPNSVGLRIDGNRAGGFKSVVLDAYTQYNQGGIGVSITNFGYAQLVSLFTICCDIAVYNDTGGVCDMNNSNASFGNFGLWANGTTPLQYVGIVTVVPAGDNIDSLVLNVGARRTQEYDDAIDLLRANANFLANEVVGFVTSTDGPYGANGPNFDYGGAANGREKCKRDTKIIVESLALDLLLQSNINAIDTSLAYRDSPDYSLTYLRDSSPVPVGFSTGYVAFGEIAAIAHLAGISTYVIQNQNLPKSYQTGINSISQFKDISKNGYTIEIENLISSNAGIITSVIGVGTETIPTRILPKGQRPYDGQVSFIETQFFTVNSIRIDNPGFGYEVGAPVEVQIGLPDLGDDGIPAEVTIFEDGVGADGTIQEVSILVSGTGYLSAPTVTIAPPPFVGPGIGTTATATAVMQQLFFNVVSSTPVDPTGITTVTFDQFITYPVSVGASVNFFQASKIIASGITFEYIGTGTDIVNSIPSKGAVPIDENQIVATNGGRVPFTSTDQGGNFRISEGITINQNTGTISGTAFSKSLQSEVTPLIIALGGS